uniref:Reverse transcriptase domain-containing protein n=1 Tax=Chromera velia CCMP2878 TaxID=1169474 RepID=A0A0G4G640_9ALVE|eukprot:Cvel_20399.t1-p1 / transcript=Cvel_20399.t1 / gene=Cvel_20399 / organism=Chromera_velia_CCMP2878 / gene_product=hypothetical protein / transcript_product=hypothetical protein / location=Cvel_scaffold1827:1926-4151(+) / protein_length=368 / sequence_SO=supercontig / SO=protein_coding / is_pseudo=false
MEVLSVAFVDFTWAFDEVRLEKLKEKLRKAGVEEGLIRWVEASLEKVRARVKGMNMWYPEDKGLKQGGTSSPSLYSVYTHDLPEEVGKRRGQRRQTDRQRPKVPAGEDGRRRAACRVGDRPVAATQGKIPVRGGEKVPLQKRMCQFCRGWLGIEVVEDEIHLVTECPVFDRERAEMFRKIEGKWDSKMEERARKAATEREGLNREEGKRDNSTLFCFLLNECHAGVDEFLGWASFRRRVFEECPGRYGHIEGDALAARHAGITGRQRAIERLTKEYEETIDNLETTEGALGWGRREPQKKIDKANKKSEEAQITCRFRSIFRPESQRGSRAVARTTNNHAAAARATDSGGPRGRGLILQLRLGNAPPC